MTIPFLNLFKKKAAKEAAVATPVAPAPLEKASADRLSKTVMPNATRTVSSHDPMRNRSSSPSAPMASTPASAAPRTIAFGSAAPRTPDLPPAVAVALDPKVERAISLELADVVFHLPAGAVRPLENDEATRRVLLKASELERGMANGRPSVSLATIYDQVPEIFLRPVAPSDSTQVQLPFQKVLEQFTSLQVRGDQYRDQAVPQVETPFLKVTIEDNTRFGTTMEPLQMGDLPPVRVEPATAETLAAAEPEAVRPEKSTSIPPPTAATPFPLRFPLTPEANNGEQANGNGHSNGKSQVVEPEKPATAPARIPFKLSPKGTDAFVTERVPASAGPSVPTGVPTASTSAPARIPFKISAPSEDARPEAEPWLTKESFASDAAPEVASSAPEPTTKSQPNKLKISLPLKTIMQGLAPFQVIGDVNQIPEGAVIELPFSIVEPQLASGRVVVTPEQFAPCLPEEHRGLFDAKSSAATISLPLHEVLKNMPAASLRMRDDQVEQEKGSDFATPFSAKAEEDAKRFKVAPTPVAKPTVLPPPLLPAEPLPAVAEKPPVLSVVRVAPPEPVLKETAAPVSATKRSALQEAFDTDNELDAKAIVAHVEKMEGVEACAIMFGDGLSLAGTLPEEFEADGLCAMAPSLLQRIENHMVETKLGALQALTLSCAKASVTFFMHDNLCLVALHTKGELTATVRDCLTEAVHELSKKYSNPV